MKARTITHVFALLVGAPLLLLLPARAQEEAGHMHGPDGRHIAVASTFGGQAAGQRSILSHHDLMITDLRQPGPDRNGKVVEGCDVHSVIHKKGDPKAVIHREHNTFEPENGVYGSHMMYREPGEYVIIEKVTLPDKQQVTLEFPIWVPAPQGQAEHAHHSPWWTVLGVAAILLAILGAFLLGRRSGRRTVAMLSIVALVTGSLPIVPTAHAQEDGEEAGHMHGPDGRHVAVASTFGGGNAQEPLRAYPTADRQEAAVQTQGHYRFRLSIENEEMAPPDPDVVTISSDAAKTVGLTTVAARAARGTSALTTTGQVKPNPNRAATVNARVAGRVVRVGVTPGDEVSAGHVVAVLDSAEIAQVQADLRRGASEIAQSDAAAARARSQIAEAQANQERARAEASQAQGQVRNAERTLARQRELARSGAFASGPVEAARSAVATAEGELNVARTALATLEAQARRLETGVADGVVSRREAETAQSAAAQGRTRVETAQRQLTIARAALAREEQIQRRGLRDAREVQQAQADLAAAQAALRAANAVVQSEARRVQAARGGAAEAEATRTRARTNLASARNRLRLLGATPSGGSQVTVVTPLGGEVEARPVSAGEVVEAGQTLARILNTDSVWVESDVFEKDLPQVRVGQAVTIAADAVPGRTFQGRISYIGGAVNPETRAVRVRTAVTNPGEVLKPNMFVRVLVGAGRGRAILVPQEAVQEDGNEQVVFIQEGEGYRRRAVRIGATLGDMAVIEGGLKAGDKVVTQGAYQLLALAKKG